MYAYGVVLLELLTAAEVVDTRRPAACHNLVDWLYSKLHDPAAIQQARWDSCSGVKSSTRVPRLAGTTMGEVHTCCTIAAWSAESLLSSACLLKTRLHGGPHGVSVCYPWP